MTEQFSEAQEDLGSLLGLGASRAGERGEERVSPVHPMGSGHHSVKRRELQSQSRGPFGGVLTPSVQWRVPWCFNLRP